jgi:hydrophobe/amphiphile efflux-3 (HAE3) family protein
VLRQYATFIVRYRVAVMLIAAAITLFFFTRIGNLRVVVDPNDNLPQEHPYVVASNEIERIFGGRNLVVIGVESASGDVFQPAVLEKIQRITDGVLEIPGVIRSNVISLAARKAKDIVGTEEGMRVRQLMETIPRAPGEIAGLRKAVYANPIYVNSIVSRDGRMALIIADFQSGKGFKGYRPIKEAVEQIVDRERDDSVKIYLSGISVNLAWLEIYSQQMVVLFFTALAIVIVVSYLSFWSFQGTIVPVMTGLISVIWGLGVMGLLNIPMDTFNATTPILIMAIAHGHSVQILKRYYEEYGRLHDSSAAVIESLARVGPVMLTAGSMAVASFLALTAFPTLTIRVFGIFTAIGVLAAMIVEMTFVPAFRSMIPAPRRYEVERERMRDVFDRGLEKIGTCIVAGCGRAIFATALVVLVLLAAGIRILTIDNSLKGNFSPDSQVRRDDVPLNAGMGGTNTLYLLIEGPEPDAIKNPAALRAMEAVQRHLERASPLVGKTQSLADFMKKMNKAMHADDPKEDRLPDTRQLNAQYLLLYSMSGDPGDFDTYVDYEYKSAVIWAYLKTDSTAVIERIIADLRPFVAQQFPPGYKVSIGGGMAQGAALNEVMVQGKLLNIGSIAASIYLISSLVLRSALAGLFVLIPLTLAVLANFGVMGLSGIRLDIGTSAVSAMAVGVGADYAIYLIYRLREEMAKHGDPDRAVTTTLATAGKAVTFVALAVGSGYSVLMLGGLGMHQRLGFLVAVAMVVSCLAAIALLPAILHRVKPRFAFGNGGAEAAQARAAGLDPSTSSGPRAQSRGARGS